VVIVYTDRRLVGDRDLAGVAVSVVAGGASRVVLREKDLGEAQREALADRLRAEIGDLLLVSDVDGAHRDAAGNVVGRAAHSPAQLAAARDAAYATLSPVWPTASKPGYGPALGLDTLREWCAASPVPVYALGGIDSPARAADCVRAGAAGVAVLGIAMRAADPSTVVSALKEAVWNSRSSR
jgi:thiamine-phosphate pyrophosphorylase